MIYIDNGGDTLGVGHLDWVLFNKKPKLETKYRNVFIDKTPQLDDRLGVWVLLHMLKEFNCNADILLTDSEENHETTAQYFSENNNKQYNWMFEFDRQGPGAVMYDYEEREHMELLRSYGYKTEYGSFTDICELEDLGCKGFNLGVGYHRQHTNECYANIGETFESLRKFAELWKDWHEMHLEHTERTFVYKPTVRTYNNYMNHYNNQAAVKYYPRNHTPRLELDIEDNEPLPVSNQEVNKRKEEWEFDIIAYEMYGASYEWLNDDQRKEVEAQYRKQQNEEKGSWNLK